MADAEVQQILQEQDDVGSKLERLLINFGKDPSDRKTEGYIARRITLSDRYWRVIQSNHKKLTPFQDRLASSKYFKNEYFKELEQVYHTLTSLLLEYQATSVPTATTTEGNHGATSSAGAVSNSNNKQADENSGNLDDEEGSSDNESKDSVKQINTKRKPSLISEQYEGKTMDMDACKLIRKQRALMRLTTHQIKDIESRQGQQHPSQYFKLKIDILKQYQREMVDNDQQIWEIANEDNPLGYKSDLFYDLDGWTQDTIISLQQQASILDDKSTEQPAPSRPQEGLIKLPKISLPIFDGNYLQWTQFHDLYVQLIHNQTISNTQKMFYLKTNLSGEARALIQHLQISNENYDDAWSILNNRYNNKRLLVTAILNRLLSQPTIQTESAAAIKSLHDITNECLHGLKNLGLSTETWDPLVIHIVIKKLDKTTHGLYEQSLETPRELDTIGNFLKFLETRFQSLEALGGRTLFNVRNNPKLTNQSKPSAFMATSMKSKCISCKQSHPLYSCKDFLSKSPSSRLEMVRKHNLCVNCMKGGHSAQNCSLRGCKTCSSKHNTLLHLEREGKNHYSTRGEVLQKTQESNRLYPSTGQQNSHTPPISSSSQKPTTLAAQVTKAQRSYVLLSTVIVRLRNNEGSEVECRAILDSGSQLNFITEQLAKKLSLRETFDPLQIQGIGQGPQRAHKRINVELRSRTCNFSTRIEAHILPEITTHQPSQSLDITNWSIPRNIELADPGFNCPGRIDLLIGADTFFQLLLAGQIKLEDTLPILQNTKLGWIVSGKTSNTSATHVLCGICSEEEEAKLTEQVERFWKQEEVDSTNKTLSASEIKCESHFNQSVRRDETGRFVVRLPFANEATNLGESKDIALNRFYSLERKLTRNPDIRAQYINFLNEYKNLGHMEEISLKEISGPYYFLPHHCVTKPDSTTTKLRVVFDASMKTSSNVSLNDI